MKEESGGWFREVGRSTVSDAEEEMMRVSNGWIERQSLGIPDYMIAN